MNGFTRYDLTTGRVLGWSNTDRGGKATEPGVTAKLPGRYPAAEYYIRHNTPTARQTLDYSIDKTEIDADGVDTAHITDLPTVCTVHGAEEYPVTDGAFNFTATAPGSYNLVIDEPAYLRTEIVIDAN